MTGKTKKIIFFTIAAITLGGGGVGYYLYNKQHFSVAASEPAAVITAAELHQVLTTDSLAAKKRFIGDENNKKVIQVNGEVAAIKKDQAGNTIVLLKTATDGAFINCSMEEKTTVANTGSKIAVKGICTGYNFDADMGIPGDVILTRCYIVQ